MGMSDQQIASFYQDEDISVLPNNIQNIIMEASEKTYEKNNLINRVHNLLNIIIRQRYIAKHYKIKT